MKNVLLGCILMGLAATSNVYASDVTATVGASSDYFYRGVSLTNNDPAVFGSLKVDNVVLKNLSVSVDGVVLDTSPFNNGKTLRSELGISYKFVPNDKVSVDVGAYRVFNPVVYANDYNEVRSQVTWAAKNDLKVYGKAAVIVGDVSYNDTFVAVGVEKQGFLLDRLTVGAEAANIHSDFSGRDSFNNLELTASYKLTDKLEAFGLYSVGGSNVANAFDGVVKFNGRPLSSGGLVGLKYTF